MVEPWSLPPSLMCKTPPPTPPPPQSTGGGLLGSWAQSFTVCMDFFHQGVKVPMGLLNFCNLEYTFYLFWVSDS